MLVDVPVVRDARNGGVTLAYQAWGTGPRNLVVVPPLAHNVELAWERRELRHLFVRFGAFSRTVHFDKRGTGASDRSAGIATLDERIEDLRAVMDAADVDRATVVGMSDGGARSPRRGRRRHPRSRSTSWDGSGWSWTVPRSRSRPGGPVVPYSC